MGLVRGLRRLGGLGGLGQVRRVGQMGRGENSELGTSCKLATAGGTCNKCKNKRNKSINEKRGNVR